MSNNTTIAEETCNAVHFLVPIFGGALTNETAGAISTYAQKSDEAHIVLGSMIFLMVTGWCFFIFGYVSKISRVFIFTGIVQISMGVYLFSWVFIFLYPADLLALYRYSSNDLLQLQHMSISSLLIASGFLEICHCGLNMLSNRHWHTIWCLNVCCAGLVFIAHPQHSPSATAKHMMLGSCLVTGSILLLNAKRDDFKTPDDAIDWNLIMAGGFYSAAAVILVIFHEKRLPVHMGTTTKCQGAWVLTIVGYVLSSCTVSSVIAVKMWEKWKKFRRKKKEEPYSVVELLQSDESYRTRERDRSSVSES